MQNGEKITISQEADSSWDSLRDFAGEQNLNSKTGKARTFSEFDLYPKMPGESNEEYGERLKFMHEKTAEYEAAEAAKAEEAAKIAEKAAYFASEQGQKELDEEAKFDRLTEKLDQAIAEGRMSAEHANSLLERQLERSVEEIEGHRQDYKDRQSVGTPEEEVQEDATDKEPGIKLLPEIQADLDDKLADIAKWRERDAKRLWRGESGHSQEFYDKMIADVTAEAAAMNQALLEQSQTAAESEPTPPEDTELDAETGATEPPAEDTSNEKQEGEEKAKRELEEAAKRELEIAEAENDAKNAKLEILAIKEEKIRLLNEKIAAVRKELDLIDEAKKKPRFSLLSRIFRRKTKSITPKYATPETAHSGESDNDAPLELTQPEPEVQATETIEQTSEPEAAEETPFTVADSIRQDKLGGKLDDEGVDILTSEEAINDENTRRIAIWWNGLSDDVKHDISTFEKGLGNSRYGRALRTWLQTNEIINP